MSSCIRTFVAAIAIAAAQTGSVSAAVPAYQIWNPGFVIRAEDRFDPAIQRLMAEHSLRLLPLERGQLYYVYPIGMTPPRLEGMQIRYLETLLDKQAARDEAEKAAEQEAPTGEENGQSTPDE
jgi:hypothetical protein